jgi:hypothetical protein
MKAVSNYQLFRKTMVISGNTVSSKIRLNRLISGVRAPLLENRRCKMLGLPYIFFLFMHIQQVVHFCCYVGQSLDTLGVFNVLIGGCVFL